MRKLFNIMLLICILTVFLVVPEGVGAKTLRSLETELNQLEADLNKQQQDKQLTQAQINNIYANINTINDDIERIQNDIKNLNTEIVTLNEDISLKDKEIKDIINFVQISNGESAYLEYAFGAKSFTDFIYRVAVSEQLTNYNENLITKFNAMIVTNKQKTQDLATSTNNLIVKQDSLDVEAKKLGTRLSSINNLSISTAEQIKLQREAIALYKEMGCGMDEDISNCGRNKLPAGTAFFRPIESGHVTSEFGNRVIYLNGQYLYGHTGLDLSGGAEVPVYAAGNGMVIAISRKNSCGGNMVYVHHKINGQYYTTLYAHLLTINVTPQQAVTRSTVIGIMGGGPSTWGWEKCSSGTHLHFQMATGLYLKDYYSFSTFNSRSFNPRNVINFPSGNRAFTDRLTKY